MRCFRRLKDKVNAENDDGKSVSSSSSASRKDSLAEICKQTPQVLLHRISPSTISRYKSNESIDSGNCLQIMSSYDASPIITSPSARLERELLIQTPPPEPSLSTSTPKSTRNLHLYSNESSAREVRAKRPLSEEKASSDVARRKILRDSVS